jgi:hypothetical protein
MRRSHLEKTRLFLVMLKGRRGFRGKFQVADHGDELSGFPRAARLRFALVKHFDELAHRALQRIRQVKQRAERRHGHATFEITDDRHHRAAALRDLSLRQAAGEAQLAQVAAEYGGFIAAILTQTKTRSIDKRRHLT